MKGKVTEVKEFAKMATATIEGIGKVCFFKDAPFASLIKVEAEIDVETEEKQSKNDETKTDKWIVSVNGQGKGSPRGGGGGGGGGRPYQPRTREEIHAASIAGILKTCIERDLSGDQARAWLQIYRSEVDAYAGTSSTAPTPAPSHPATASVPSTVGAKAEPDYSKAIQDATRIRDAMRWTPGQSAQFEQACSAKSLKWFTQVIRADAEGLNTFSQFMEYVASKEPTATNGKAGAS